jgi:large subunit ribosomal protein L1
MSVHKISKRMQHLHEIKKGVAYTPLAALEQVKQHSTAKFDESVDITIKLGIDTRNTAQTVRGTSIMPGGLGKKINVVVFSEPENQEIALAAGATAAGLEDLIKAFEKQAITADVVLATPGVIQQLAKIGKILGPKGLMPSLALGTVTNDIGSAVAIACKGQVFFRADKYGFIHSSIGKVSFDASVLLNNFRKLINDVKNAKPTLTKGTYLQQISLSSTMGTGFNIDIKEV